MIKVGDGVIVLGNYAVVTAIGGVTNSETGQETKLYNFIRPDGTVFFCTDQTEIKETNRSYVSWLVPFLNEIRQDKFSLRTNRMKGEAR